jgi:hypothetical protein
MKYVFFALEAYPLPIAKHLVDEGYDVLVGILQSANRLMIPGVKSSESAEDRAQRLSIHDGIIKKYTADAVLKMLWAVPKNERDDYFIFFDYNNMFNISDQVLKMGYTNGLFPTKWYYRMEKERALAKKFVEDNYKEIKVADSHGFSTIQDGINFINESEKIYVLKSNGNSAGTIVPKTDDVEEGKSMLVEALTKQKKGYEAGGFLLEEKIPNCLEVTPVMVFYNGEPIYSLVELECKSFGAGDIGVQKGGNLALSIRTPLNCEINKRSFPEAVYKLAKKQPGLAIYDMGLLYNGEDFYFTEYCAMRYGWDGIFSEIVMRDDGEPFVGNYFEDIKDGVSPLINEYGASVRLFNLGGNKNCEDSGNTGSVAGDGITVEWKEEVENNLFLYMVKKKGKEIITVGGYDFMGVATGASNVLETAVEKAYAVVDAVKAETLYYRPKFDFLSMSYKSSILNRLAAIKPFIEEIEDED